MFSIIKDIIVVTSLLLLLNVTFQKGHFFFSIANISLPIPSKMYLRHGTQRIIYTVRI